MQRLIRLLPGLLVLTALASGCGFTVVSPGQRGIKVTLGKADTKTYGEGMVFHFPIIASVVRVSIRQETAKLAAECYSSDLQQVNAALRVLFRVPEEKVMQLFVEYAGIPFDSLIAPRVAEALKEVTALETAETIVKGREKIKEAALESTRKKIGPLLQINDLVIENITLSQELEKAIESKMVQQQEAAKAEYTKTKARTEAETAVIRAQGEADAIKIRGNSLRDNPRVIDLLIAEKWDGKAPLAVGGGASGASILLPTGGK